ncbi:13880_t:CDS:2 [Gigaspora margarita]|uniref:13880_t:CDS:1 n=1 Tax=Gigaspora margarita TaxID=4874 RepID=A0ABN7VA74_GIGMA|nr:13880_t:CDS:2 [Gigaspora margarita]
MTKVKLKTGDLVKVITGKHRGTIDYISRLNQKKRVVYLKKVGRKKYDKSTPDSKKKKDKKKITKIGFQEKEGKKVRIVRKFKDKKEMDDKPIPTLASLKVDNIIIEKKTTEEVEKEEL